MTTKAPADVPKAPQRPERRRRVLHFSEALALSISFLALFISGVGPYQQYYLQKSELGIQLASFGFAPTPGDAECYFEIASYNTGNRPSAILDVVFMVATRIERDDGHSVDSVSLQSDSLNNDFEGLVIEPGALSVSRISFQGCYVPWLFEALQANSTLDLHIHTMDHIGNRFETFLTAGTVFQRSENTVKVSLHLLGRTDVLGDFIYGAEHAQSGDLAITKTGDDEYLFSVERSTASKRFN